MTKTSYIKIGIAVVAAIIIFKLMLNMVVFAGAASTGHLQGDQWVWVKEVLIPYRAGEISLYDAITYEYRILSHTHTLTLTTFLLDERFFGLQLKSYMVIGVASLIGVGVLLTHAIRQRVLKSTSSAMKSKENDIQNTLWFWGLIALSASAFYQIGLYAAYTWSLVLFEHIYLLMALSYLYLASVWLEDGRWKRLLILTLPMLIFADAMGALAVVTTIAITIILAAFERKQLKTYLFFWLGSAGLIILIGNLIQGQRRFKKIPLSDVLEHISDNFLQTLEFALAGIGRSTFTGTKVFRPGGIDVSAVTVAVGIIMLLAGTCLVIWAICKKRLSVNTFALMLMAFSIIGIIGIIRERVTFGDVNYIYSHRYYRFQVPYLIGTVMLLFDFWTQEKHKGFSRFLTAGFLACVTLHVSYGYKFSSHTQRHTLPSLIDHFDRWDIALKNYDTPQEKDYSNINPRCRNNYCADAIQYLDTHDLSVFSKTKQENVASTP